MKEYYTDNYNSTIVKKDEVFLQGSGYKLNEVFKVKYYKSPFSPTLFDCKKTNDGYKIDWEATIGYNPISLKIFQVNLTTQPTEFRVIASLGSYYNYNYKDSKDSHWNVDIWADNANISGCYISKSSTEGKKIYEILKDGQKHKLILEIKIDATADNQYIKTNGNIAIITNVVQEGWSKE